MKKILLIAAFFVSTGVLSSCTKDNEVAPSKISKTLATDEEEEPEVGPGNLGTGDGGVERPPVKKP